MGPDRVPVRVSDRAPVILVAGSLHMDVLIDAPHLPRLDETVTGTGVRYAFGGKGGHQALAAARMGAKVEMAGMVGTDDFGPELIRRLDQGRVGRAQVLATDGPSGMSVAVCQPDGSHGAVIVSGANLRFRPERVAFPRECAAMLLQNEVPDIVNTYLARRAATLRIKVILNAAPTRVLPVELLQMTDLLVVNRSGAADLLGQSETGLDPVAAAVALGKRGPGAVIVTMGSDGLAIWSGQSALRQPAFSVKVRSAHGAGATFLGALAAEWARGAALEAAARFGQAAAALAVSSTVDARAMIGSGDVRALLKASADF
jgi:ribokinase